MIRKCIQKHFTEKIFQDIENWEREENGYSTSTYLCLFLIMIIGGVFFTLMMVNISTDLLPILDKNPLFNGSTAVVMFLGSVCAWGLYDRCSTKNQFLKIKKIFKKYYQKLEDALEFQFNILNKNFITAPLKLPQDTFSLVSSYLSPADWNVLGEIDHCCHKKYLLKMGREKIKTILYGCMQKHSEMWQTLKKLEKKQRDYDELNEKSYKQYTDAYGIYPMAQNGRFIASVFSLSSSEGNLKNIHSKFFEYHTRASADLVFELEKIVLI